MNTIAQIIYDNYKGEIPAEFSAKTKKEREDLIRNQIFREMGLDGYTDSKTFRRALRENEAKVFNIIEEVVDRVLADGEYAKRTFYNQFVEVKNLALGDKNEFYVEGANELEVSEFSGSHFELKRRRVDKGQSFSVEMRNFGIKIYEEMERILSGRADLARLVVLVTEAVDKHMAQLAESTFMKAVNNLPAEFKYTGSYDEEEILKVSAHVRAANSGVRPRFIGTEQALSKLVGAMPVDMMSSNMKDEINGNGVLNVWKGHTLIPIEQGHQIGTFKFTMPEDKIFVMSSDEKLIKLCLEGESMIKETNDYANADLTQEYALIYKAGVAVAYSGLIGVITLQ